jgi:hypothetical protein
MKSGNALQQSRQPLGILDPDDGSLLPDPRWVLTQRVVAGPQFARSALLCNFLSYVVSETLAGRSAAISEHKIGVAVFGRSPSYRTDDDNIVRNYARQLRKRLAEHFSGVGSDETVWIDIPVGGYVPSFVTAPIDDLSERGISQSETRAFPEAATGERPAPASAKLSFRRALVAFGGVVAFVTLACFIGSRILLRAPAEDMSHTLWRAILTDSSSTFIVPSDVGFNLLEDMAHQAFPLSSYIKGAFAESPDGHVNNHTDSDLRTQEYTDFVSTQIIAMITRRPEYDPKRAFLRFPRDLRINDLKTGNALIIGSVSANPWAGLIDSNANFHILPSRDMESASIVNTRPVAGEAKTYASHWNEPAHDTYALILFLPNLSGSGHVLAVEGLDVAGTQAAAEVLFHPDSIASILKSAQQTDGSLRPFEILIRATSIESNAAGTQIIASRIH